VIRTCTAAGPALAVLVALAACSPPGVQPDLLAADQYRRQGRYAEAIGAYDRAAQRCRDIDNQDRAKQTCAAAALGRAETFERMGRRSDSAAAYEAIPAALNDDPVSAARALFRAGKLRLELGQDVRGYELLWAAITRYPDAPGADLALKVVHIDGRRRNPRQLYDEYGKLYQRLAATEIADNLLYLSAELARDDLQDPQRALRHFDELAARHPKSLLYDDAVWHAAALARQAGDPQGAVRRYRQLLSRHEVSWFTGSYNSQWYDDSWLQMGIILRDELKDNREALHALEQIPKDYPESTLLDDATWERAVTHARMNQPARACALLATLQKRWPDSKYELELGPQLRAQLGCK
jgi:tetratricopeptide (TPR) repeat protein